MLENIALIKEVHELLGREKAEALANEYLQKIGLSHIGLYRLNQCSDVEIFYVMYIRALMSKATDVIITTPFSLISNLRDIEPIIATLKLLGSEKNIFILDSVINELHYKEKSCHIVK